MRPGRTPRVASLGIAGLVAACSSGSAAPQAPPTLADGARPATSLSIVAEDLAYTPEAMSAPAGSELSVQFLNRDRGVPHDLALFSDAGRPIKVFGSVITTGVSMKALSIPSLAAGTYQFRCYVHPEMAARLTIRDD